MLSTDEKAANSWPDSRTASECDLWKDEREIQHLAFEKYAHTQKKKKQKIKRRNGENQKKGTQLKNGKKKKHNFGVEQ